MPDQLKFSEGEKSCFSTLSTTPLLAPSNHAATAATLEQNLIAAARNGEMTAFAELVERHRTICLRIATVKLRNREDAEDEVQNAFWKAFQRLDQYRADGPFGAWITRIVDNQCLMLLRKQRYAQTLRLDQTCDWKPGIELTDENSSPEEDIGGKEVAGLLTREVLRMPPLLRHVIILRDLDQLRIQEVAARLGVSVPAAKSRLMRAREELRARIRKHCGRKGLGTLMHVSRYPEVAFKRAAS